MLQENYSWDLQIWLGDAIAEINQRDTDAMLEDLFTLMELVRVILPGDPFNVDYILIDTSPGLTTNAINGVAITDQVIMILRISKCRCRWNLPFPTNSVQKCSTKNINNC